MDVTGKELLFSVTKDDCRFDYFRASGKGGQKRNKTSSACRCTHIASGAVAQCSGYREKSRNRREAFVKMADTLKFKAWVKIETARVTGRLALAEERLEKAMHPRNLRVDIKENGLWVEEKTHK